MRVLILCLILATAAVLAGCASSGAGGREVKITQADDGCSPTTIEATPGEKLNLVVKNGAGKDYEVEGIEGTKLEEVIVPEGRTRSVGYDVPDSGGVFKIKCYTPGGSATIIEVHADSDGEGGSSTPGDTGTGGNTGVGLQPDVTVRVALDEFTVETDKPSVPAGNVEFAAINEGAEVHELYVLRLKDGDEFAVAGEIESIGPGESGTMTLKLEAGEYKLACLIIPGEAGSTKDHFKEGMETTFAVK